MTGSEIFSRESGSSETELALTDEDFRFFKKLILETAGISLTDRKSDLVSSRLRRHLKKIGIASYSDYRRRLEQSPRNGDEIQTFINLLTTNKTEFFREAAHFEYLSKNLIPSWLAEGRQNIAVWCCASSTGEEAYTLSLVLNHGLKNQSSYRILASDIDTAVLDRAKDGVYRANRLIEIPAEFQNQNVRKGSGSAEGWFRIESHIHEKIVFKQHNLVENTYPGDAKFDVVFCRNVLIYFSGATIRALMEKLYRSIKPGGHLFISHTESIAGCDDLFKSIGPSIFQKI